MTDAVLMRALKAVARQMPVLDREEGKSWIQFTVPVLVDAGKPEESVEAAGNFRGIPEAFRGQILLLKVQLTNKYPEKPPSLCLGANLIYHPFIGLNQGSVCMSARGADWAASGNTNDAQLIHLLELGVPTLLGTFEGEDPHNIDAYELAMKDFAAYAKRAELIYNTGANSERCSPEKLRDMILAQYNSPNYPEAFAQRAKNLGIQLLELKKPQQVQIKRQLFAQEDFSDDYSYSDK